MKCCRSHWRFALLLLALVARERPVDAQKQPGPPVPPNPQAPVLNAMSAAGMQRGTTLEVSLMGANLSSPTAVYTSFPARVTIPEDNKNGQDAAKLRVRIEVPNDAPLGYHSIRVTTTRGISNFRLFCIDDLPQIAEVATNRDRSTPQVLPVPCVVSGKVDTEKSTWFQITAKAGERLSFDVLGRRLGGPIDPQISLYDAKSKRELAHDNDAPGCQSDPRLSYVFKAAGDYLIEIKDVLNRGGADYHFRLRVGDFPLATVPIPMAVQRGHVAKVSFAGPAVADAVAVTVGAPLDLTIQALYVAPKGASGLHGWPVPLAVTDYPEMVEKEPNHELAKANRVPVPGGITGRFLRPDETDYCIFGAKKGQKILIEVQTLELHSPTLVYMVLRNAKTKAEIGKTNPQANPPLDQVIDFTAPEDGDYVVEIQHLNYLGGPSEAYHLSITPSRPSFEVSVGLDRFDLSPDGFVALPLQLKRTNYAGPVDVTVHGAPGLTGKATIGAGQQAGVLVVRADADLPMGPYLIALVTQATIDKEMVTQLATVRPAVSASLGNLPFPPRDLFSQIAIGVRERAPCTLIAKLDHIGVVPGLPASVTVVVERDKGFDEEIILNPPGNLPPGVAPPKLPTIAKGKNEVKFKLDINAKVPPGQYYVTLSGKGKQGGKEFQVAALPVLLDVSPTPFNLEVAPVPVTLAPGGKAKIVVKAIRRGGYDGPITVEIKNLPAKVTATKGTLAKDQTTVELEISVAEDAPVVSQKDVQIAGVATGLGNAAVSSPAFVVSVEKEKKK